jgi:hypothetical protein
VTALALALAWPTGAPAQEPRALATPPAGVHVAKPSAAGSALRQLPQRIEGESLVGSTAASAGPVSVQDMAPFGTGWSGGAQLFWRPPDPVDTPIRNWPHLTFGLQVPQDGTYALAVRHTRAPDYGDVRVFVRGQAVVDLAGYAPSVQVVRVEAGKVKLKAGSNQVVLTVFRRPAASEASFVGLDALELVRQP